MVHVGLVAIAEHDLELVYRDVRGLAEEHSELLALSRSPWHFHTFVLRIPIGLNRFLELGVSCVGNRSFRGFFLGALALAARRIFCI